MSEHISGLTDNSMKNLKDLVDTNSVIGEPIVTPDGTMIIPISKVSFGFATGGSDLAAKSPKDVFGGGSGGGRLGTQIQRSGVHGAHAKRNGAGGTDGERSGESRSDQALAGPRKIIHGGKPPNRFFSLPLFYL